MTDVLKRHKNQGRYLRTVMGNIVLMIALSLLMSCATGPTHDDSMTREEKLEDKCRSVERLGEEDIRRILFEAKMHWDAIRAHVASQKNKGGMSQDKEIDFTVQDTEFTKYYDNALMLYLSGDISSDFYRSLITIQQLFIIAEGCYPEVRKETASIDTLDSDCISAHPLEEDNKRTSLFKIKSEWDELNIMIHGHQIRGSLSGEQLHEYDVLKERFNDTYRNACILYLKGDTTSPDITRSLKTLEEINLDSSRFLHDMKR